MILVTAVVEKNIKSVMEGTTDLKKINPGFSTRAIHVGQEPEELTGAVVPPIFQTSTFQQSGFAEYTFDYSRADNPTRKNLEHCIASLEEGTGAVAFGSGMAAESAIFSLLSAGDHIILSDNVYGGTFRVMDKIFSRFGLTASWVNTSSIDSIRSAITKQTRLIFIETPTNPMMQLTDIAQTAKLAKDSGVLLAVDNTFMSPYFQRPLSLDADLVVHSTTKYLNGHSDVVGGIVISKDESLLERLRFIQMSVGAIPGPFDCWLTLRSLKTLAVRMQAHHRNAMALAHELYDSGAFKQVFYPGLISHPHHELAKKQQVDPLGNPGFGGMISVELKDIDTARRFVKHLHIFTLAESLGGVESLVCHPATMTHASIPAEKRHRLGLSDGLVRLSVGIEDTDDLLTDIRGALAAL